MFGGGGVGGGGVGKVGGRAGGLSEDRIDARIRTRKQSDRGRKKKEKKSNLTGEAQRVRTRPAHCKGPCCGAFPRARDGDTRSIPCTPLAGGIGRSNTLHPTPQIFDPQQHRQK